MNLKKIISAMKEEEYHDRIPKMIHWVYDHTMRGSHTSIYMTWFKSPKAAEECIKEFIDDGGLELCFFSNDYSKLIIKNDIWTQTDINNVKNKKDEKKKRTNS
jgi:hypothetical protein